MFRFGVVRIALGLVSQNSGCGTYLDIFLDPVWLLKEGGLVPSHQLRKREPTSQVIEWFVQQAASIQGAKRAPFSKVRFKLQPFPPVTAF